MAGKKVAALTACTFILLSLTACGQHGNTSPKFQTVNEADIKDGIQVIELNESEQFYSMSIKKDATNVYYYAIGYDDNGKLADKTVISTMPSGMDSGEQVVLNATFPEAEYPSYAVGFVFDDGTDEYYILEKTKNGKITAQYVKDRESFFIADDMQTDT